MKRLLNNRVVSIAAFSFLFAYILSFLFEGQTLYSLIDSYGAQPNAYILSAIVAHFIGLFSCGYFINTTQNSKLIMLIGMAVCLIAAVPFFFSPSALWFAGLVTAGYAGGCAVAAWGFFLKRFTPKNERIKSCADVLIFSNIIMIANNVIALNTSNNISLLLSMLCLIIGGMLTALLPSGDDSETITKTTATLWSAKLPEILRNQCWCCFCLSQSLP